MCLYLTSSGFSHAKVELRLRWKHNIISANPHTHGFQLREDRLGIEANCTEAHLLHEDGLLGVVGGAELLQAAGSAFHVLRQELGAILLRLQCLVPYALQVSQQQCWN